MPYRFNVEQLTKATQTAARRAVKKTALWHIARQKRLLSKTSSLNGPPAGSRPGKAPGVDTGNLRRAFGQPARAVLNKSKLNSRNPEMTVGGRAPQARILEKGGVVRPRRAKMLPVPIHRAAKLAQRRVSSVKQIKGLVMRRMGRSLFLGKVTGRGQGREFEPWFVLKRQIRIRKRPFVTPLVKRTRRAFFGFLGREIGKALK